MLPTVEPGDIAVVAEASDGLEAIRLCEEQHPDLRILDISMPKLSGIEVATVHLHALAGSILLQPARTRLHGRPYPILASMAFFSR